MFRMDVQEVFAIRGRGAVVTGPVNSGQVGIGDQVRINGGPTVRVDGVEVGRKKVDTAAVGDHVGVLFSTLTAADVTTGDVITSAGGVSLA